MDTLNLILIIVGGLCAMVAFWAAVLWLLAVLSGWRELARRFGAEREPRGEKFSMASGGLGWVRFNSVLRVWVSEDGLGLGCLMPAAFGAMPALLIPWRAVTGVQRRQLLFWSTVRVEVDDWRSWITLRGAAGEAVLRQWQALGRGVN